MIKFLLEVLLAGSRVAIAWFGIRQIDLMDTLDVPKLSRENEEKVGKLLYDIISAGSEELDSDIVNLVLDKILERIFKTNYIDCRDVKLHLLRSSHINAMKLPDNHMVIYTGLIDYCEDPGELYGVMAHERAHMQLDHVKTRMTREVGLSILHSMTGK